MFDAIKDVVGCGVIRGFGKDLKDFPAVGGEARICAEHGQSAINCRRLCGGVGWGFAHENRGCQVLELEQE